MRKIQQILPDIGLPVSVTWLDEEGLENASIGEVAYVATLLQKKLTSRLADPALINELAMFHTASGSDWAALDGVPLDGGPTSESDGYTEDLLGESRALPQAPENYCDSMPGLAYMLKQLRNSNEAAITFFASHLEPALHDQPGYLGVPVGVRGYKDVPEYLREVMKYSRQSARKVYERLPYVTFDSGKDSGLVIFEPRLPKIAQAYADSSIPSENLDRVISLDKDLTDYVEKTGQVVDYKNEILKAFEPALMDVAQTATPDELSQAKQRWANKIVHAIDPDGPLIDEALQKPADNAIRTRRQQDGSGKVSAHLSPGLFSMFQSFLLNQLKENGTNVEIPESAKDLLFKEAQQETTVPNIDDINTIKTQPANTATAIDEDGTVLPADTTTALDPMTTGQKMLAIVIGMFQSLLAMNPEEIAMKRAHGTTQLVIVQDIQTAYKTLRLGDLPKVLQRPPGPNGVLQKSLRNKTSTNMWQCADPNHEQYQPPPWTSYFSETMNNGPIHPKEAAPFACDSELVGQIWNGQHTVLAQYRTHRVFTPTQRRAVLARDRGCQIPGCTIPAIYCQIHHIEPWQSGGLTNTENAATLCVHHHASIHNGKWKIIRKNDVPYFQPAPWLDPDQPLLRNMYWGG